MNGQGIQAVERVLALLRVDAPAVSLVAAADQLEAFARDEPDSLVSSAGDAVGRAAVAVAGTSDRQAWGHLQLTTRALRIAAATVSDTRHRL